MDRRHYLPWAVNLLSSRWRILSRQPFSELGVTPWLCSHTLYDQRMSLISRTLGGLFLLAGISSDIIPKMITASVDSNHPRLVSPDIKRGNPSLNFHQKTTFTQVHHRKCVIHFSLLFLCFLWPAPPLPLSSEMIQISRVFVPLSLSKAAGVFAVSPLPYLSRPPLTF